tara:strand:- start:2726 stop:4096 length:1371 start_codon:yes stop_codon:yes gene_type:complete
MEFKNRLNLVVDLNADKTKIYNGLSPTKIQEDTYSYGYSIFARHVETQYSLCYIQNLLDGRIMYKYIDSETLDKKEFNSKWIYVLEPIGDPNSWLGTRESKIQKLSDVYFSETDEIKYTYDSIDSLLCGVSDKVLEGVRDNKGIILLYVPYEGYDPLHYKIFDNIHKELKDKKIPFENFCYVTGNQIADKQYEQWSDENDIEDKFQIICYNDEEFYPFWENRINDIEFKPEKYFLCYNRRPHIHRIILASLLEKNNLIDKGLMSFPDESFVEGFPDKYEMLYKLDNIISNVEDIEDVLKYYKKFKKRLPLLVDTETLDENLWFRFDVTSYKKTFFSVVVETLYNGDSIFIDEKVWKVIDAMHPFVFVGNHHGLKKLKELGYRTFHPYINEEYDNTKDPIQRMKAIVKEIKRLTDLSFDDWYRLMEDLNPILKWNRKCKIKRDGGAISFLNRILEIL